MSSKIPEYIKKSVKDTVGYSEAENKESFMIGSQVSFYKAEDYYNTIIEGLQNQLAGWKTSCQLVTKDITTISTILNQYNNEQ